FERKVGPDSVQLCPALWQLTSLLLSSDQREGAMAAANRCVTLATPGGAASLTLAIALHNLGVVYHRGGAPDTALPLYQRSLAIFEAAGPASLGSSGAMEDPLLRAQSNLGLAYWHLGDVAHAYSHLQRARQRMSGE